MKKINILYLVYPSMVGLMSRLSGVPVGEFPFYEDAMSPEGCQPPWGALADEDGIEPWLTGLKEKSRKLYLSVSVIEPKNVPGWCHKMGWRKALESLVSHSDRVVVVGQTRGNFIYDGIILGGNGPNLLRTWGAADSVMDHLSKGSVCRIGANRLGTKKGVEILHRYLGVKPVMQQMDPRSDKRISEMVFDAIHGKNEVQVKPGFIAGEKHIIRREMFNSLIGGELGFVAVYFNACGFRRPRNNFKEFIKRFKGLQHLLIVELAFGDKEFELTGLADNMLQLRSDTVLWQKEALINAGTQVLRDKGYENVGWLDGDTVIDGPISRWYSQCIDKLKEVKLIQCFDTITQHFDNVSIKATGALSEHRNTNDEPWKCYACGGSWAVRGDIWDKCGWYDLGIAGSGDRLMFIASLQEVRNLSKHAEMCGKDKTHLNVYKKWVAKWRKCIEGSVDYIEGVNFSSEAHGKTTTRAYRSRAEELIRLGYQPAHVGRDVNGVFRWSKEAPKDLINYMLDYFINRKEDG